ncbi:MAG TPA: RraA family protein [Azospirillum sp.]|nr:RraA family protein [Azospirillum sp.]
MHLTQAELDALAALDTPTVCNALELLVPERRGYGYSTKPFVCPRPELKPMVGYAVTATIRAMLPPREGQSELMERRLAWYRAVEASPRPSVMVIQDLDQPPGFGAFWGEVHTAVHQGLGALGVVTDGSIRDLDMCAPGFQMLAGSVGPSHAWVRVEQIGVAVTVHGMTVHPGDLVHADRHGAVVIPHDVARQVTDAAARVARREAVILDAVRRPGFNAEALARALGSADEIH